MSSAYELTGILLGKSVSDVWEEAEEEPEIGSCYDNPNCREKCFCGH